MLAVCWCVLYASVSLAYCYNADPYEGGSVDFYNQYYENYKSSLDPPLMDPLLDVLPRIRRGGTLARTSDGEIEDIRGAIKQILAERNFDLTTLTGSWGTDGTEPGSIQPYHVTDIYDYLLKLQAARSEKRGREGLTPVNNNLPTRSPEKHYTRQKDNQLRQNDRNTTTTSTTITTTITTTARPPPRTQRFFDIEELIALVANLTYDYDMNLTQRFNESLIKHSLPSCPTFTTTTPTTTTTTTMMYDLANTTVVAKCFVCGLDTEAIPRNAFCADAFAGDFIPLVPVDPSAKGHIARYRKYCRYLDVNHYMEHPSEPRALYGRWTGGCSVRWTDLSGVYTQRTCRNSHHATTGEHFASKRMAKLEMTLSHMENGCIVSPMASLLPLSRGISLYARFHACVCTGSWCNRAISSRQWTLHNAIPTLLLIKMYY